MQYKGTSKTSPVIGKELNVNYLIGGSAQRSGDQVKIRIQLINAVTDNPMWVETFEGNWKDILSIQSDIAKQIADKLKTVLSTEEIMQIDKKPIENPEAYNYYLQGRFYYNKFAGADNFNKAIYYFKEAIKIEPNYALAYAGIASSYMILWVYNYLPPEKCRPQMKEAAEHSIRLDNEIAESHIVMARMKMYYEWDFAAATIEYKKAIELNPNLAEAHDRYAICLSLLDNYTEAAKQASIAYSLDPISLLINDNVATVYWLAGDYEKVLEYGRRSVELDPNFWGGHNNVGRGFMYMKRYKDALPEFKKAVDQNYSSITLRYLGTLYGLMGEKVKAREMLEKMENLRGKQWVGNCDIGIVYVSLGEFDKAIQYFEIAMDKREGFMLYLKFYARYFPEFGRDPRTKKLLERIGLPY
jgi:serine/threonine-protein kinase